MEWEKYYKSESDLIADMLKAKTDTKTYPPYKIVKGYEFIDSFKRYYEQNGKLTAKQMTQLKRLAFEIYKNVNWECFK